MIDFQGQEVNRNNLINSEFIARDVAGNKVNTGIFKHEGLCANFTDEDGSVYQLPQDIKLTLYYPAKKSLYDETWGKVNNKLKSVFVDDIRKEIPEINELSLKDLFAKFASLDINVISYLGEKLKINIQNISYTSYGWPSRSFDWNEKNLTIKS